MLKELGPNEGYNLPELERALARVKTEVFLHSSSAFYAPLMAGLDFMWTKDVPTAATDGTTIYWNPDDFAEVGYEMQKSTLLHELYHVGDMHFLRQGDRDPQEWNIAGDYRINFDLKKDGFKAEEPYFIFDKKYDEKWAVEDIYDDVKKQCAPRGPGGNQGQPQQGQGSGTRSLAGDLLPTDPQKVQQAVNNVIQAVQAAEAAGQPGAVPGSTRTVLNNFLKPIVRWESLLDRFFQDLHNDDYSWRRPNRRHQEIYLPVRQAAQRLTHLIYYLDVSGSVSDRDALRFNSEVKHIKDRYNPQKLTLVLFDTKIQKEITITENDQFNEIEIVGRGGTDLGPVRKHMMDHKPEAAIVFSDLYVNQMEKGPQCPVIWITVGHPGAKVKFGQIIHIPNEK